LIKKITKIIKNSFKVKIVLIKGIIHYNLIINLYFKHIIIMKMNFKGIFKDYKINNWINQIKIIDPLIKIRIYYELELIFFQILKVMRKIIHKSRVKEIQLLLPLN